uniref:Uncharacterized protein n=1 Tax=Chromera velia CCMP2878 TaxID=1169474 RepID=A0A0G4FT53_9ALVE|eukprot:Cvel_18585.t1-p1 / transcript=Cvel_18585.t1 / gene=Cvel_18585 / organism=Chromera_velia_CCMP2878 / gene_product=hypothetical protein / transcript_product=hypothetical protein / location=Cvel_scaffold1550:26292-28069(+) / protein_length=139 / sequence_SO=supercontig / SO=protein_coding / is_pseudo=false
MVGYELARKVTGASEVDLIQNYIDGLPPEVKFKTDRTEPQTLDDAMARALDMELWLSTDSSCRGFGRGARGYEGVVIPVDSSFRRDPHDLTGPALAPFRQTGTRSREECPYVIPLFLRWSGWRDGERSAVSCVAAKVTK